MCDLWPLLFYNVHDIVPLQMMSKMGGLGGMDNPMGVSVNPNSLSSIIVVVTKSLFSLYLLEPGSLSLNKFIDFWRFYSSHWNLATRKSSSFLLLLLMVTLYIVSSWCPFWNWWPIVFITSAPNNPAVWSAYQDAKGVDSCA